MQLLKSLRFMDNHTHIISASLQLVPMMAGDKHPYHWIDEVIDLIRASGVNYSVGPFSTSVEADYKTVTRLIDTINSFLVDRKCDEWVLQVQFQIRSERDMTSDEKLSKYRD